MLYTKMQWPKMMGCLKLPLNFKGTNNKVTLLVVWHIAKPNKSISAQNHQIR